MVWRDIPNHDIRVQFGKEYLNDDEKSGKNPHFI